MRKVVKTVKAVLVKPGVHFNSPSGADHVYADEGHIVLTGERNMPLLYQYESRSGGLIHSGATKEVVMTAEQARALADSLYALLGLAPPKGAAA